MGSGDIAGIFQRRLRQAVKASTGIIQEEAQDSHVYKTQSSFLERSVTAGTKESGMVGRVFLDTNIAPYGPFVHEGTRPHMIFPKNRKALRWVSGGRFIFARSVHHPGWQGDPFLYNALDKKEPDIEAVFNRYVGLATEEVKHAFGN